MGFFVDKKYRVLLFGGTFNPIHNGHLRMAQEAIERLDFNEVIFIPSATPPHKTDVLSYTHRLKMAKLAIQDIDYFKVSTIEAERGGPSHTIDTVRHFQAELGLNAKIYWLIGSDTIKELKTWHKIEELFKECKFLIAERCPYRFYGSEGDNYLSYCAKETKGLIKSPVINYFTPLINDVLEISSTDIRNRIEYKEKYAVRFLVPQKVEQYIYDNQLYKNK